MKIVAVSEKPDLPEAHLIAGIARSGAEVLWFGDPGAELRPVIAAGGAVCSSLPLRSRLDLRAIRELRSHLSGTDLIHAFTSRAISNSVVAAIGRPVPIIAYRGTMAPLSRFDPTHLLTYRSHKVRRIICVSAAVREALIRDGLDPERLAVIHKGHRLDWYQDGELLPASQFGVPEGAPFVVCIANARPVKGVDVLIRSFPLITGDPAPHLLLIGKMEECAPLIERLPQELRARVHFTGFQPAAYRIIRGAHALAVPSRWREGLPKAAIEGMAQGVPIVASDVGGLSELIENGVSGLLVQPEDPPQLAAAISRLLADSALRRALGEGGCTRIRERFNAASTLQETLALYSELTGCTVSHPT